MRTRLSEDELIAAYFAPLAGPGAFGLRDDAAVLRQAPGDDIVVTKDMLIAGVHFFHRDPPGAIARKALRANLSDLAAKGAEPRGFLLGLALPEDWTPHWLAAFAQGLGEDAAAYKCVLLGGDTVKSPGPLIVSISAFGSVPVGAMVPRGGVEAGDTIYVSGTIGDAALGQRLRLSAAAKDVWAVSISQEDAAFLASRYLLPQPRLELREALRAHAHAAMDISDGFAGDLAKMLRLTGMTAEVLTARVPISRAARYVLQSSPSLIETVFTGGDDYEILCAVPPSHGAAFETAAADAGVLVRPVATAAPGNEPPAFRDENGQSLAFARPSFRHF
ncbi:MAG: thiamine-phosphate kinase [Beijerinckiaceae bacterium]|nr:thiamine-phosphate kinase [Beijerinckiaceae bacterium]MCI0736683.1 thiamine-phosphate kinase [Beijerinckiaceae bacterium]